MSYKHKTPIQIRWVDTDMLGHVNNSNHLSYMEMARVSYFKTVLGDTVDWTKEGIIVAKASVEYKRPIFLDDKLVVYMRVEQISGRSFNVVYRFVKDLGDGQEQLCAEGATLMVCYDFQKNMSIEMPAEWRKKISEYEGIAL